MKRAFTFVAACGLTLSAQAGCYSVYNSAGALVHRSTDAPVDTTYQYHQTVPQRFGPGATLVYDNSEAGSCPAFGALIQVSGSQADQGATRNRLAQKADRG